MICENNILYDIVLALLFLRQNIDQRAKRLCRGSHFAENLKLGGSFLFMQKTLEQSCP